MSSIDIAQTSKTSIEAEEQNIPTPTPVGEPNVENFCRLMADILRRAGSSDNPAVAEESAA
jgi:hypothetical protein